MHADLGVVEWDDSLRICQLTARHFGSELIIVKRAAGDLMDRWEARWRSSMERYMALQTVTLVPCWSTPRMRFCTSELKTQPIKAALRRRFPGQHVVNVTGIRRQESARRAKASIFETDRNGRWTDWRPIVDWSESEVFASIESAGMESHPAYRCFSMTRVLCRFCIMSSLPDLHAAARQAEAIPLYRRMVALEAESGFAFQGGRWLGDIAPEALDPHLRSALKKGKITAAKRASAEAKLAPGLLFVKGWPTRPISFEEAALLADVRRTVSDLYGFQSSYLDAATIQARYRELIAAKAVRAP